MKILFSITVAFALIFGTLFVIGYTGKQAEKTATETAGSFYILLVNWINSVWNEIAGVLGAIIVILFILFWIWMMIPKTETTGTSYSGY